MAHSHDWSVVGLYRFAAGTKFSSWLRELECRYCDCITIDTVFIPHGTDVESVAARYFDDNTIVD